MNVNWSIKTFGLKDEYIGNKHCTSSDRTYSYTDRSYRRENTIDSRLKTKQKKPQTTKKRLITWTIRALKLFQIPTDSEHVTLSENKRKIQNKWCHICLAPAPVILQFFIVVVCTVFNVTGFNVSDNFKVEEPKTLLQRAKREPLRKNIQENQGGKVSVQNSLKPFLRENELLYLTLVLPFVQRITQVLNLRKRMARMLKSMPMILLKQ